MASRAKVAGYFWVKVSIGLGLILGLLLLAQTVGTYRYVSRGMVRQEAQNEADRRALSLARLTRNGARDSATLAPLIEELVKEAPAKIAWMRVLNTDGKVIASGGNLSDAPDWTQETLRAATGRGPRQDVRATGSGEVLIGMSPLNRFGGFGRGGRGGPQPDQTRGGPPNGGPQSESRAAPPFAVLPEAVAQGAQPGPPRNAGASGGPSGQSGRGRGGPGPGGPGWRRRFI